MLVIIFSLIMCEMYLLCRNRKSQRLSYLTTYQFTWLNVAHNINNEFLLNCLLSFVRFILNGLRWIPASRIGNIEYSLVQKESIATLKLCVIHRLSRNYCQNGTIVTRDDFTPQNSYIQNCFLKATLSSAFLLQFLVT